MKPGIIVEETDTAKALNKVYKAQTAYPNSLS